MAGSLFRLLLCLGLILFTVGREDVGDALLLLERLRDVGDAGRGRVGRAGPARWRAPVRFPTGRATPAAFAGALTGAFAVAAARVEAAFAGAFARVVVFVAVFFSLSVFSAIGLCLLGAFAHHREKARDLSSRLRHGAEVLELARGELELRVEELLTRAAQLVSDLVIRQPPHVLHPPLPPLSQ